MRVLVVDDDAEVRRLLVRALERDGHAVTARTTARAALTALGARSFDVVVLDLALPDGNGVDVCQELRALRNAVPVLMLTAHSEVGMRVDSLDAGADDFLGKPFAVAELRARVRALGRRGSNPPALPVLVHGSLAISFSARRAARAGRRVELTAREWVILEALAARAGRLVSRVELLEQGWGEATEATAASLEVLVGRIRRKLGSDVIRTVRGAGYALEQP
jgi:two-component system OmpR family response regulator